MSTSTLSRVCRFALAGALGMACLAAQAQAQAQAQQWTLSLSWRSGSCSNDSGEPSCAAGPDVPFAKSGAGATATLTVRALRGAKIDCGTTAVDGGDAAALPADIARYLASSDASANRQQWDRYGSCSGYTPTGYFNELAAMARAVARTNLGQYLNEHAGQRVSLDALKEAQLHDFFLGADKAVQFYCASDGRLAEIRYTLRGWSDIFVYRDKGGMLVPAAGGNCGEEVRL